MKIFNTSGELILEAELDYLIGAKFSCVDLRGAILRGVNLSGVDLRYVNFSYVDLRGANLTGAILRGVNFSGAKLSGVNFSGADLSGAYLTGVNFSGANFSGADLTGVNFNDVNLSDADLIVLQIDLWTAYITTNHIRIGCQSHTLSKWENFTDKEISDMHPGALEYWTKNKEVIIALCKRFNNKGESK